ncbi:MAG: hypothetical protein UMU75_04915, partial [Halomonas sp.]|nr:hypothetical protein [Halomonas sp.]
MKATTETPILLKSYLLMVVAACITAGAVGLIAPLLILEPGPLGLPLSWQSAMAALLAGLGLGGHLQRWRALHYSAGMGLLLLIGLTAAANGIHPSSAIDASHLAHDKLSIEGSLLLAAIAFCLMIPGDLPLGRRPWQWVGGMMLFLGTISGLWMLLGNAPWLRFHSTTAWVTILFTVLFGGAMWLAGRLNGSRLTELGGLAVAAAFVGSLFSAVAWYQFSLDHNRELQALGEAELDRIEILSQQALASRVETLDRLSPRW